jgi:putative addiction module component (TIGR02574 family)
MKLADIQIELERLSYEERVELIHFLWNSISTPQIKKHESLWAMESERRIDAFNAGKLGARNARSVLEELKNQGQK